MLVAWVHIDTDRGGVAGNYLTVECLKHCYQLAAAVWAIAHGIVMGASRNLLKLCSFRYAGLQFPTMAKGRTPDFAVIRIFEEERDDKWQVGFYSFDGDIMQIEEGYKLAPGPETIPLVENLNRQPP